jgi:hypothetical protein
MKAFPLKSRMKQGCPFTPLLFNIVLEFQARAIRRKEQIKGIQVGKEIFKVSLFADGMILYLKDPKISTPKLLDTISSFSNVVGYKINSQKSAAFLYTNNEQIEKEYRETFPFTIASKKHLGIILTKDVNDFYKENYQPTLFFTKVQKLYDGEKTVSLINCWVKWLFACRKLKLDPCLSPCTSINSKWIKDLYIRPKTLKLLQEKAENIQEAISIGTRTSSVELKWPSN